MDAKVELIGKKVHENAEARKISFEGEAGAIMKMFAFTIRQIAGSYDDDDALVDVIHDFITIVDIVLKQKGYQS